MAASLVAVCSTGSGVAAAAVVTNAFCTTRRCAHVVCHQQIKDAQQALLDSLQGSTSSGGRGKSD